MVVPVLALVIVAGTGAHVTGASAGSTCKGPRCKSTPTPTRTATPNPTATAVPSATPTPVPTSTSTPTASPTPSPTAALLNTYMTPWYLADSTGNVSVVNATMTWDGDTNQSSPLPTGTLTATVYDSTCPTTGCIYTHTITSSDFQWAFTGTWSWSLHYAFSLGTEYPPTDTFWLSYSGDGIYAGSSAQATNT